MYTYSILRMIMTNSEVCRIYQNRASRYSPSLYHMNALRLVKGTQPDIRGAVSVVSTTIELFVQYDLVEQLKHAALIFSLHSLRTT